MITLAEKIDRERVMRERIEKALDTVMGDPTPENHDELLDAVADLKRQKKEWRKMR